MILTYETSSSSVLVTPYLQNSISLSSSGMETEDDSSVSWPLKPRGDSKAQRSNQSSSGRGLNNLKVKKAAQRTVFTPQQLYYLEERFVENQFPDTDQRERIASHLNLTPHHVQVYICCRCRLLSTHVAWSAYILPNLNTL